MKNKYILSSDAFIISSHQALHHDARSHFQDNPPGPCFQWPPLVLKFGTLDTKVLSSSEAINESYVTHNFLNSCQLKIRFLLDYLFICIFIRGMLTCRKSQRILWNLLQVYWVYSRQLLIVATHLTNFVKLKGLWNLCREGIRKLCFRIYFCHSYLVLICFAWIV